MAGKLGLKKASKRLKQQESPKKIEDLVVALHTEAIKKLTVRMPISLHRKLKAKTALDDTSINEFVIGLIEDALINEKRITP